MEEFSISRIAGIKPTIGPVMLLPLQLSPIGWLHTACSIVALVLGLFVVTNLVSKRDPGGLLVPFVAMALATNVTALPFFDRGFGIAQKFTLLGLVLVGVVLLARSVFGGVGFWGRLEAAGLVLSTWLLVFFTINEAFIRVPVVKALAPTLSEAPFRSAQLGALVLFLALTVLVAVRRRH